MRGNIRLFNEDCMEAMRQMKDKQYDLAIVDPPYGIGMDKGGMASVIPNKSINPSFEKKDWDKLRRKIKKENKNSPCWDCKHFDGFYFDGVTFDCKKLGMNQLWGFEIGCEDFNSQSLGEE